MPTVVVAAPTTSKESVKETIISVIIAFAMAFVFRSFVAEAFIIPTGSMAPTLNGAHMRYVSPYTGEDWAVSPVFNVDNNPQNPYPNQAEASRARGGPRSVTMHDPITGLDVTDTVAKARAGDRIFVLKFLYGIQSPDPFDVVVFKNPTNPDENYIKRLIGLPGEQIALVDGDVFYRPAPAEGAAVAGRSPQYPWDATDWKVRRKPAEAQRAVWQPVFDSALMSNAAIKAGAVSPWVASGGATAEEASTKYVTTGAPATIAWDRTKTFVQNGSEHDRRREINDRYAYNEIPPNAPNAWMNRPHFPVADMRLRATVMARKAGSGGAGTNAGAGRWTLSPVIEARGHEFRATISGGKAVLSMRPVGSGGEAKVLSEGPVSFGGGGAAPGSAVSIEFWHSDQQLQLWVDGKLAVSGVYDWLPMERLQHSMTTEGFDQFMGRAPSRTVNVLSDPASYRTSGARWETSGAPVELRGVALDRDLYYRPADHQAGPNQRDLAGKPGTATHPKSTLTLTPEQFFVCGDNSPSSLDGRLWGYPDPWVAEEFDASPSVVASRLMMGKAFFVYFPAPVGGTPVGVPDFGRLRAIR